MNSTKSIQQQEDRLSDIDRQLFELLHERATLAHQISPDVEQQSLKECLEQYDGPLAKDSLIKFSKQISELTLGRPSSPQKRELLVARKSGQADTLVRVNHTVIGGPAQTIIAGPCAVESLDQLRTVAASLKQAGVKVMRGGAFKPRTSPYDFQGLGVEGLQMLKAVADEYELTTISEIVNPAHMELAAQYIDIIQIGARNMHNFELLKAAGETNMPVVLKRGLSATLEEFVLAAEYIASRGNTQIILIERGIRTYEKWTRNTLDISAVPILKQETHLPVLVDVTHSTGRKDIMVPCAKAALAAGADGIMVEVHPDPRSALSDAEQQLDPEQFQTFCTAIRQSGLLHS
ncbi:3-deoxy-7-phosphoheptulonate synthase [Paenibacillaceae bacterium]|nr:3-deoxy-7-phosphoheptulonate synthase [Paenibacillaceae bacterium]